MEAGWNAYMDGPSPRGILCVFKQEGGEQWVGFSDDLRPEFNVANLYWKLTGIGRERLDSLSPAMRAQVASTSNPNLRKLMVHVAYSSGGVQSPSHHWIGKTLEK